MQPEENEMDPEYEIQVKDACLQVVCRGNFSMQAAKTGLMAMFEVAARENLWKILVDARAVRGKLTTEERFYLGDFLVQETLKSEGISSLRIGLVGDATMVDPRRFGETVARNRGVMVKVGTDWDEICQWLGVESGE